MPLHLERLSEHPVLVKGRIEIPEAEVHGGGWSALEPEPNHPCPVGLESGVIIIF